MAINKPNIPDAELPEDWGGTQYPYTEEQIENGLPEAVPTVIDGGNLNYEKKGLFQNIKYLRVFCDWLRNIPIGKIPVVNSNGQLDYDTPVVDSSVVHNTGDETVGGVKTFTNGTASVKITRGDAAYTEIMTAKKDGTRTGGFRNISDNHNTTQMYVTSDDGTTIKGYIAAIFDGTNVKTHSPTPPASDNSNQIATTAWVNTYVNSNAVKTSGDQTIDGVKTFNEVVKRSEALNTSGHHLLMMTDSTGKGSTFFSAYYASSGLYNRMQSNNQTSGKHAYWDVVAKDDGTSVFQIGGTSTSSVILASASQVTAPTPAASDNSTKVATTAWVTANAKPKITYW